MQKYQTYRVEKFCDSWIYDLIHVYVRLFVKFVRLSSLGIVKIHHDITWFCRLNYSIIRERWSFQPTQFRVTESEVPVSGYDIRKKFWNYRNDLISAQAVQVNIAIEVIYVPLLLIPKDFSTQFSCQSLIALRF